MEDVTPLNILTDKSIIQDITLQDCSPCSICTNIYEGLSDEELKEIYEDYEADYWIEEAKSDPEM